MGQCSSVFYEADDMCLMMCVLWPAVLDPATYFTRATVNEAAGLQKSAVRRDQVNFDEFSTKISITQPQPSASRILGCIFTQNEDCRFCATSVL